MTERRSTVRGRNSSYLVVHAFLCCVRKGGLGAWLAVAGRWPARPPFGTSQREIHTEGESKLMCVVYVVVRCVEIESDLHRRQRPPVDD